jgi:hypothetical protein
VSAPDFTAAELDAIAAAVQWAGFYAERDGCNPGGPAFSAVRRATALLEPRGAYIPHSRAVRALIDQQ